jgi:hypothetical protein
MKSYTINFAGYAEINAESEAEAMTKFRKWIRMMPFGIVELDGYNCTDEEEIEDER